MKIYISGPITGVDDFMSRFMMAESKLIEKGHEVINPAKVNSWLPESTTHSEYMSMCYPMIDMSDALYMLDSWEKSKCACIEYGYALGKDKIIVEV